ncbi:MAG: YkgJ family cysteine cluster protein [Bacillota bacterium]
MYRNIIVYFSKKSEKWDLKVLNPRATVGDYLDGVCKLMELLQGSNKLNGTCETCGRCCKERIPITSIDWYALTKILNMEIEQRKAVSLYTKLAVWGRAVDVSLKQRDDGSCIFLQHDNRCSVYEVRPFTCKTFFCLPQSMKMQEIRATVVNLGMDQLIHEIIHNFPIYKMGHINEKGNASIPGISIPLRNVYNIENALDSEECLQLMKLAHEMDNPNVREHDWQSNLFANCLSYHEIELRAVCSQALWSRIYKNKSYDLSGEELLELINQGQSSAAKEGEF